MPWQTERYCHGLNPEWGIWDYSDQILSSYVDDRVLVIPLEVSKNNPTWVSDFLDSNPDHKVVLFSMSDPAFIEVFDDRVIAMEGDVLPFWEFFCSHYAPDVIAPDPTFELDFLCYQRKPNHYRPDVYQALSDQNGIVTLGIHEFDFNKEITTCSTNMSDVDYTNQNYLKAPKVKNDLDTLGNPDIWSKCFLNIVSETQSDPLADGHTGGFVSEKTFKPIMGKRPFITLGAGDRYYKYLNDLGYYTFESDFPRKSSNNFNHADHAKKLADFLQGFDKESYYYDNKHKFDHNYEHLCKAKDRVLQNYKKFIQSLFD